MYQQQSYNSGPPGAPPPRGAPPGAPGYTPVQGSAAPSFYPQQGAPPSFYPQQPQQQQQLYNQTQPTSSIPNANYAPPPAQGVPAYMAPSRPAVSMPPPQGPPSSVSGAPSYMMRGPPSISQPPVAAAPPSSGYGSPMKPAAPMPNVTFFSTVGGNAQPISAPSGSPPLSMGGKTMGNIGPPTGPPTGPPMGPGGQ